MYLALSISMAIMLISSSILFVQQIQATGGSATLAKAIQPLVEEAREAAQNGDTDAVLELLEEIEKETKDSFEIKDE